MLMWNALPDWFYPLKMLSVLGRSEHAYKSYRLEAGGLDSEANYMRLCHKTNWQKEAACLVQGCMPFNPSTQLLDL